MPVKGAKIYISAREDILKLLGLISCLINAADELTIYSQGLVKDVPLLRTGIAWPSDKDVKFRNPSLSTGQTLKEGN